MGLSANLKASELWVPRKKISASVFPDWYKALVWCEFHETETADRLVAQGTRPFFLICTLTKCLHPKNLCYNYKNLHSLFDTQLLSFTMGPLKKIALKQKLSSLWISTGKYKHGIDKVIPIHPWSAFSKNIFSGHA